MTIIRIARLSSRWDRSPSSLLRSARGLAQGRSVLLYSELAEEPRATRLRRLGRRATRAARRTKVAGAVAVAGWGFRRGRHHRNADDAGILWRKAVWDLTHAETVLLTTIGADWRPAPPSALVLVLVHRHTGTRFLFTTAHLPLANHQEQWDDCVETWARALDQISTHYDVEHHVVSADWNRELRDPAVARRLHDAFARVGQLRLSWVGHAPARGERGTHGRGVIDGSLTDLTVETVEALPNDGSSDHNPVSETLGF